MDSCNFDPCMIIKMHMVIDKLFVVGDYNVDFTLSLYSRNMIFSRLMTCRF